MFGTKVVMRYRPPTGLTRYSVEGSWAFESEPDIQARRFQPALTWLHGIALAGASLPRGNSAGGTGDWLALTDADAVGLVEAPVGAVEPAEAVGWLLGGDAVRSACLPINTTANVPPASSRMTRIASNQGPPGPRRRGG